MQNTFEEWLGNYSLRHEEVLPEFVEKEFKAYYKCGILAHGFARAYCEHSRADFIVGFSCKKRGVCPSCTTKHMISITTHLLDTVLPKLPLRQWVLSVPKWLRFYIEKDAHLASQVLRIFIDEIEKQLKKSCDGIMADAKLGAVSFIQRFGSRLNHHLHYHCVVLDGLFYKDAKSILQFADVYNLGIEDTQAVVSRVRRRVLSLFKRRNLLTEEQAENLANWKSNGGFSVNADVHIDGEDRKGAARLIRYCARPAFSGEKLVLLSEKAEMVDKTRLQYDVSKHSQKTEPPLNLSATDLFDNLSKLIPPPRRHRHHYHGVLGPNSPYRSQVIKFANALYRPEAAINKKLNESLNVLANEAILICLPKKGSQSWAKLIAQVYEVDPLRCEQCGETMKLIAFIKDTLSIKAILSHLGEACEAPKLFPPRGPPEEWDVGEEFQVEPDSDYQYDQTVDW